MSAGLTFQNKSGGAFTVRIMPNAALNWTDFLDALVGRLTQHPPVTPDSPSGLGISGLGSVFDRIAWPDDLRTPMDGVIGFQVVVVDRSPPESLVKAWVQRECRAMMEHEGRQFLSRKTRSEIRASVEERLAAQAQPIFKPTPVYMDSTSGLVWIGGSGDATLDRVIMAITDGSMIGGWVDPFYVTGMELNGWAPCRYVAGGEQAELFASPEWVVPEFLMWLILTGIGSPARGWVPDTNADVSLAGYAAEMNACAEVKIGRGGSSLMTAEFAASARSGKLPVKATYLCVAGDGAEVTINRAGTLKIKLMDKDTPLDAESRFCAIYERMSWLIDDLRGLFATFRADRTAEDYQARMQEVSSRLVNPKGA